MDERLRGETPDDSLNIVRQRLRELTGNNEDFYMKAPNETKSKDPLLRATKLLTAQDKNGRLKNYYYVRDSHRLHKVLVTEAPQLEVHIPSATIGSLDPEMPHPLSVDILGASTRRQ
jgi:hypothetical protein